MAGMYGITVPGGSRSSPFNPMKLFGQQQAAPRPMQPPAMPGMRSTPQFNFARQPTAQAAMPKQAVPPAPSGNLQTILNSLTPNVQPGQATPPAGWNGQPSAPVAGATNAAQTGGLFSLATPAATTTPQTTAAPAAPAAAPQPVSGAPIITSKGTLAANDPYIMANPEFRDVNVTTPEGRAMMAARMLMNGAGGGGGGGGDGSGDPNAPRVDVGVTNPARVAAIEAKRAELNQQLALSDNAYNEMIKALTHAKLSSPDYIRQSLVGNGFAQGPNIPDSVDGQTVLRRDLWYANDLASQIRQAINEGKTFDTSGITDPAALAAIQKYQQLYGTLPRFGNSIYSPGFVPSSIIDQGLMKMANQ